MSQITRKLDVILTIQRRVLLTIACNITANLPSSKIRPEVEHGARRVPSFISVDGAWVAETETAENAMS